MIISERGAVNAPVIINILLSVLVIGFGAAFAWAYMGYSDQKTNVDQKITAAVEKAKTEQKEADEKDFTEREKSPYRQFVGPDDLGSVSFEYPKTWSVYIDKNGKNGDYEAYLHPLAVLPVDSQQPDALRVTIETRTYDQLVKQYQQSVTKGELKADSVSISGFTGLRLDGKFARDLEGSMVIFKVRDKTVRVYTESAPSRFDFDNIILKTLTFKP